MESVYGMDPFQIFRTITLKDWITTDFRIPAKTGLHNHLLINPMGLTF